MLWLGLVLGLVAGIVITVCVFVVTMRKQMVVAHAVPGTFEEVCSGLEETLHNHFNGWGMPFDVWDFYKSQVKKDLKYDHIKNCRIYPVCKPPYANEVVSKEARWAGIMPCSWAIYETPDGQVYVSKLNTGLLSKMMTGAVGTMMKKVAAEEVDLLAKVTGE